jgi:hypothetical protein
MTRKTFFSIVALVIILMTGFFYAKLSAMPANWCSPEFDFECDAKGQLACEGELIGSVLIASHCEGEHCDGYWMFVCDEGTDATFEYDHCIDDGNFSCGNY